MLDRVESISDLDISIDTKLAMYLILTFLKGRSVITTNYCFKILVISHCDAYNNIILEFKFYFILLFITRILIHIYLIVLTRVYTFYV